MQIFLLLNILICCYLINFFINAKNEEKKHFFYNIHGILSIDGSVPGQSDPITLDLKAKRHSCATKQYYTFRFCPDVNKQREQKEKNNGTYYLCADGISFCYEPILTSEYANEVFTLNTQPDLDVSKKCGELFRGFKISYQKMFDIKTSNVTLFYEIQLAYMKESYFFRAPKGNHTNRCIDLWLGNELDLTTSVRDLNNNELFPTQVKRQETSLLIGITNDTYNNEWPDTNNNVYLADKPSLRMLYLDMKSLEFVPQMMFTVAPGEKCTLYARVSSNRVGKCQSGFKQKTVALRAYGHETNTIYTLILESGVNTNSTHGSKSVMEKILEKEFEEAKGEEDETINTDEGIQTYDENVSPTVEINLESATQTSVKEKDITPTWKKTKAAAINAGAAAACGVASALTFGLFTCNANVEYKDTQTTTFHEAYNKKSISSKKTTHSTNSVHSVQNALQTVLTHSKKTELTTKHTEERSLSNAVSTRKIFVWEVEVPAGKIVTPYQMAVDCDGNSVTIPWMEFKVENEKDHINDDLGTDVVPGTELDAKRDDEMVVAPDVDKEVTQQETDFANAFELLPNEDYDYSEFLGEEEKPEETDVVKPSEPPPTYGESYYEEILDQTEKKADGNAKEEIEGVNEEDVYEDFL